MVIGLYRDMSGYHGYSLTGGTYTPINYPGKETGLQDINNAVTIVGWYLDSPDAGFTLTGTTYTPIDYPGAQGCSTNGINDAGVVVGRYTDATGTHAFIATPEPSPPTAGEDPYISIVGQDNLANPFYFSPKYLQFMYNENGDPFNIPAAFGTFPPPLTSIRGMRLQDRGPNSSVPRR